jgi:ABC-type lipoprotein export system ATPase subunit
VGFVFQAHHLLPSCTVLENVMLPGLAGFDEKASQQLKDRANQLLEEVGLGHRTAHFPGQISGGEKQRVAVARSLINQPAVLLADEPTGALDNKNSEHLIDLLKKLNDEKGLTLLMVTHSVDSASQMKEAYRLDEGSLRQER